MWFEIEEETYYRFLAVVSILVVLFTIMIPILMKLSTGTPTTDQVEVLFLTRKLGNVYTSQDGRTFEVREIIEEGMPPPPPAP